MARMLQHITAAGVLAKTNSVRRMFLDETVRLGSLSSTRDMLIVDTF